MSNQQTNNNSNNKQVMKEEKSNAELDKKIAEKNEKLLKDKFINK